MRSSVVAIGLVCSFALLTGALPAAAAPAAPGVPPLGTAQARAAVLRAQVADLEHRTDVAVEEYDEAQQSLADAVSRQVRAASAYDGARAAAGAGERARSARIRRLYQVGGSAAVLGSVLRARTPTDALRGVQDAQRLLGQDAGTASRESADAATVAAATRAAEQAAGTQVRETQRVDALVAQVQGLLARQRSLLAEADQEVVRLAEEQRREAERREQAAFQARLAEARAAQARAAQARLAQARAAQARAAQARAAQARAAQARAAQARAAQARAAQARAAEAAAPAGSAQGHTPAPGAAVATAGTAGEAPASGVVAAAIAAARQQLGKPYVWGATGPGSFDCSGLTGWAYAAAGVHLPRTSRQQWSAGSHPSLADLQPGDLLFWSGGADPSTIHHVALYIGGGRMIAAPHTGTVVQVQDVYANGYFGATRVVGGS